VLHQAGGDVAAGDDPHEFAGAVQHGKTAEAVPVELRHRAHEGKMVAQRDDVPRHPPLRRFVDVALVEGVDDVFDADQPHRDAVLEDGHARDAVGLHQMLDGAQRIARPGGHRRPGHGIAHAQFVNQDLGNGNFERLARGHAGFGWGSFRHGHGDRAVTQLDRHRIMRHRRAGGQFRMPFEKRLETPVASGLLKNSRLAHVQRHLADGVRRAAQARVVAADAVLDAVEHRFGNLRCRDVMPRDLRDGLVHRQVVLAGGDDEVDLLQQAVAVHGVVVEQRAARGFAHAHAAQAVDAGVGAQVVAEQFGVVHVALDAYSMPARISISRA
jgi:hypothetical protein